MKRNGKLAKRCTKSLGIEKYVSYYQCEVWSLNEDFEIAVLLQCRHLLIPSWTTSGSCREEYLGMVFWFELLRLCFLQKIALLITDLVMKIQPHRNNLLLFYYLKGRLNIYILLIEWSSFRTSFCTLMLAIFVGMSPASIISRLLSFLLLDETPPLLLPPTPTHLPTTIFAEASLPKSIV